MADRTYDPSLINEPPVPTPMPVMIIEPAPNPTPMPVMRLTPDPNTEVATDRSFNIGLIDERPIDRTFDPRQINTPPEPVPMPVLDIESSNSQVEYIPTVREAFTDQPVQSIEQRKRRTIRPVRLKTEEVKLGTVRYIPRSGYTRRMRTGRLNYGV